NQFSLAVAVLDQDGNTMSVVAGIQVGILGGLASGGTLTGTTTKSTVDGVATFTDLMLDKAGAYTLFATGAGFSVTTNEFSVVPGAPAKLVYLSQPANVASLATLPLVQVAVQDAFGNLITAASSN